MKLTAFHQGPVQRPLGSSLAAQQSLLRLTIQEQQKRPQPTAVDRWDRLTLDGVTGSVEKNVFVVGRVWRPKN